MVILRVILFGFMMFHMGCGNEPAVSDEENSEIEFIHEEALKIESIKSLLISIDNDVIFEYYCKDYDQNSKDHVRSVTKSMMGLMIGIAIDKGFLPDENVSIGNYLSGMDGYSKNHDEITLFHLLTMSSGIEWDESTPDAYNDWVLSDDHIAYILNKKIINVPGTVFNYNSTGSYLLGVILTEASGMSLRQFGEKYLFGPMGIEYKWQRLSSYYNGAAGMQFRPRDMVKLGQLMVDNGKYNELQIVSEGWINKSLTPQIESNSTPEGYGFQWWMNSNIEYLNSIAIGYGGQYIVAIPELNSVIVATSQYKELDSESALEQSKKVYKLIWNQIFSFVQNN